ncbi:MAG: ATP synthase F0 subunit B [Clostridia bacterium]|nr:ATP synthase F0 subunit B [Clostridia bacterium]NCC75542.1 ATP synthase F0 subunit B [Clostridia bacterium]
MPFVMMFSAEALANYASSAVFTIINLMVSFFILHRFLFKPLLKLLRNRREYVASELDEADGKLKDANEQIAAAEMRLHRSHQEAADIISNARSQAEIQSEAILSDARKEASAILSRADSDIARMRVTMLNGIRDEVADLAVAIASKVIGKVMDEKRQRDLVEQFIDAEMATNKTPAAAGESSAAQNGVNEHA